MPFESFIFSLGSGEFMCQGRVLAGAGAEELTVSSFGVPSVWAPPLASFISFNPAAILTIGAVPTRGEPNRETEPSGRDRHSPRKRGPSQDFKSKALSSGMLAKDYKTWLPQNT